MGSGHAVKNHYILHRFATLKISNANGLQSEVLFPFCVSTSTVGLTLVCMFGMYNVMKHTNVFYLNTLNYSLKW